MHYSGPVSTGPAYFNNLTPIAYNLALYRQAIITKLNRSVTVYSGKVGYGKTGAYQHAMDIIFTVVT